MCRSSPIWRKHELQQIASLFKERRFAAGDIVVQEGSGGAAFFVIRSGEAKVSLGSKEHTTLKAGDYFGEIAMFDEGTAWRRSPPRPTSTATGSRTGTSVPSSKQTA